MKSEDSIDYQDMINKAITVLRNKSGMLKNKYDHILIDEYQDISTQRYWLIKELMHKNDNAKLFCVGDDWQSIMGFSGANVKYFLRFNEFFNHPAITKLDTNYRSIKSIVDIGSKIIHKNIEKNIQLNKKIHASNTKVLPIKILFSNHKEGYLNFYHNDVSIEVAKRIKEYREKGYKWKDIMILTRIMKNKKFNEIFHETLQKEHIPITKEFFDDETIDELPDATEDRVRYMTVHKSKGLQAKVVIILNMNKGLYGFPCELESPSLFETARLERLEEKDAEELRLFYVAVTRAKEEVIIIARKDIHSKFLDYIIGQKDVVIEELPRCYYNNKNYQQTLT
jgi:DNA helicase-4